NKPRLTVVAPPQPVTDLVETAAEVAVAFDTAVESTVIVESPAMINESTATFEDFAATIEESIATIQESTATIETITQPVFREPKISAPAIEVVDDVPTRLRPDRKPIRVISDNDIALSYLETCLSVPALASDTRTDLPGLSRRFFSGVFDLLVIAV